MGIQSLEMPHPKQIPFKANVIVTSKMQIYICDTRIWFFENYNFMNISYFRPWARKIAMVHDSYLCQKYKDTSLIRPYPTQRESSDCNFIGCIPELKPSRIDTECPKECRPANHQNWTTC